MLMQVGAPLFAYVAKVAAHFRIVTWFCPAKTPCHSDRSRSECDGAAEEPAFPAAHFAHEGTGAGNIATDVTLLAVEQLPPSRNRGRGTS